MVYDESAMPEPGGQKKDTGSAKSSYVDAALNGTLIVIGTLWLVATLAVIGAYATGHQVIATVGVFVVVTMMFAWLTALCFLVGTWAMRRFAFIRALTGGKADTGTPA